MELFLCGLLRGYLHQVLTIDHVVNDPEELVRVKELGEASGDTVILL